MPEPAKSDRLRVGLLVNPIAGLGGPGAFKGSDGNWKDALAQGYAPTAPDRARRLIARVTANAGTIGAAVDWVTVPGAMGADVFAHAGPNGATSTPGPTAMTNATATAAATSAANGSASATTSKPEILALGLFELGKTTREDTARAATALRDAKIDLLVFLGGDGTAADVSHAIDSTVPCLGVPAGVKITSPVYTHDVEEAAWLLGQLRRGFETVTRDVTDLDEAAYRTGHVDIELKGALKVPMSPAIQDGKVATSAETPLEPLVEQLLRDWDPEALYLVGAGSVCAAVKAQFWGKPTLLGVDAIHGNRIIQSDLDDRRIAELVAQQQGTGKPVRVVLSTIGGQGMLLGRGTQMFRPAILKSVGWDALRIVAPPEKLLGLRGLHIDTGDPDFDANAPKHIRVITGWNETRMMRLLAGAPRAETELPGR